MSASNALAQISNGIWNIWEPIKGRIDNGVGAISNVLDTVSWVPFVPLINFELNEGWTLVSTEGDTVTGFAHDLINAGDQFVVEAAHGGGLITATVNAITTTLSSISARGGQAVAAFVDWGRAQLDYLVDLVTPGARRVDDERRFEGKIAIRDDSEVITGVLQHNHARVRIDIDA